MTNQKKVRELKYYVWIVWDGCKLAGYINAYGEWEAMQKAKEKFGKMVFVERTVWLAAQEMTIQKQSKNPPKISLKEDF